MSKKAKNGIRVLAFMCIMTPMLASAWSLTTRVNTTGGTLQVRNGTPQGYGSAVLKSYTTHQNVPVTLTATSGYKISNVQINGTYVIPVPTANPQVYDMGLVQYPGKTSQSLGVWFTKQLTSVTATAEPGGAVSPSGTLSFLYGANASFTFTPNAGNSVVKIAGLPAGATFRDAVTGIPVASLPGAVNQAVKVTFVVPAAPVTIIGTFVGVAASAGAPQTVLIGSTATLDASGSVNNAGTGTLTYAWTQTGGPVTVFLSSPNTVKPTFTASVAGSYNFNVAVSNGTSSGTASTSVTVTTSAAVAARDQCQNCHQPQNIGGSANVYGNWSGSKHKANFVMCANCHVGADTGGHPGTLVGTVNENTFIVTSSGINFCNTCHSPAIPVDFAVSVHSAPAGTASCSFCHADVHNVNASCVNCHTPDNPYGLPWPPAGFSFHNTYTGTNLCVNCHPTHNPSAITGMTYPHFSTYSTAQFATTNILCDDCHNDYQGNFKVYSANHQWAKSGKANPKSPAYIGPGPYTEANLEAFDFKFLGTPLPAKPATTTSQDCTRCHTSTGFINYVKPTNPADASTAFSNIQAWGTPGDRTREMIACSTCHTPTPFDAGFSRRSIGIETDPVFNPGVRNVVAWYGYSSAATKKIIRAKAYDNSIGPMNDSNLCITCHAGKAVGDIIKLSSNCTSLPSIVCRVGATGVFWQNVDFIDPHGMGGANIMFNVLKSGYEFRSGSSFVSPAHSNIGMEGGTQGPCVGCHMTSPKKHGFSAISTANNGVIAGITSSQCTRCHGNTAMAIDASGVEAKKEGYKAALAVIAAQLADKGIYSNAAVPPYFFTAADPVQQTFANRIVNWDINTPIFKGADMMGAAFNLRLLRSDGGGYVHNGTYVKRVLYDTIDYLDDGLQNNSVGAAIQNLAGIDQTTKDKATVYVVPRL